MSRVTLSNITKRFDGKPPTLAIDGLSLDVEEGEFVALLGPSGCGKTTTLRCVAGLERPDEGSITIAANPVFDAARRIGLPPDKREIGMVFQSYALWPHMTVRKNIAYPLRSRGLKNELKGGRIEETAKIVECEDLLDRYPSQLSGGQQQRVALARALAARPEVVLFDEPLSNLDARLREQVRAEIRELHRRNPFTAIFVTHDQAEALALGQRIAIMRAGGIEQLDTPQRVFENPATEYVAAFIGMSNRLVLTQIDGEWRCGVERVTGTALSRDVGSSVVVRFDAHTGRLVRNVGETHAHEISMPAAVVGSEFGGRTTNVTVTVGETRLQVRTQAAASESWVQHVATGDTVAVAITPEDAAIYPVPDTPAPRSGTVPAGSDL